MSDFFPGSTPLSFFRNKWQAKRVEVVGCPRLDIAESDTSITELEYTLETFRVIESVKVVKVSCRF
jgi:hypothetical protein